MKQFNISELFHTSWNDLNADQAAAVIYFKNKLAQALKKKKVINAGKYRIHLLRILCKKPKLLKLLNADQLYDVSEDLTFTDQPFCFFHITYIKTKHGTIFRPQDNLSSFTWFQFIKADSEYSKLLVLLDRQHKDANYSLNRLVSILYQPVQGKFCQDNIETNSGVLPRRLTYDLKFLVLHTYANCRKYIMQRCPNLFQVSDSGSENTEPQYLGEMWQGLLYDLSETQAFSGLETAKNAGLYDALDYLEKKARESKTN